MIEWSQAVNEIRQTDTGGTGSSRFDSGLHPREVGARMIVTAMTCLAPSVVATWNSSRSPSPVSNWQAERKRRFPLGAGLGLCGGVW